MQIIWFVVNTWHAMHMHTSFHLSHIIRHSIYYYKIMIVHGYYCITLLLTWTFTSTPRPKAGMSAVPQLTSETSKGIQCPNFQKRWWDLWDLRLLDLPKSKPYSHVPSQRSSQISAIARQFAVNSEGKVLIEFWWIPPITSVSTFNNYFRSKSESPTDKLCALCAPWSAGRWAPPPALEKSQTCHQHLSFGKICSCANAADPQEIKFASLPAEIPNFLH